MRATESRSLGPNLASKRPRRQLMLVSWFAWVDSSETSKESKFRRVKIPYDRRYHRTNDSDIQWALLRFLRVEAYCIRCKKVTSGGDYEMYLVSKMIRSQALITSYQSLRRGNDMISFLDL